MTDEFDFTICPHCDIPQDRFADLCPRCGGNLNYPDGEPEDEKMRQQP